MAINKTFVAHTELKAQDLNELVSQANGYVSETKTELNGNIATAKSELNDNIATAKTEVMTEVNKKPNILDLKTFDHSLPLPLDATYYYGSLPTHSVTGTAYDAENEINTEYIGICINHEDESGFEPQHHDVMVFVKSGSNYIYSETFNTSEASGYIEVHIARALGSVNATPNSSGLMSATDKSLFNDVLERLENIDKQDTQLGEQAVVFTTDEGVELGKVAPTGADFTNLKRGGQQVARMIDLPTKDSSIGENPSTTHVPTTKAVKEYVDAHGGGDYPMSKVPAVDSNEAFVFGNDSGTQEYVRVSPDGIRALAYRDMQGNLFLQKVQATDGAQEVVFSNDNQSEIFLKIGAYGIKVKAILDLQGNPIVSATNYLYGKKIVAIGDSMVAGHSIPDSSGNTWLAKIAIRNNMTRYNRGTNSAFMSKNAYSGNNTDYSVYSKVCESETSQYIQDSELNTADYIVVYAGTNDCANQTTIGNVDSTTNTEFCGALNAICSTLQTRAPKAHICFITPMLRANIEARCWNYINAIKDVCKKYSIPVYDQGANCGICWTNAEIKQALCLNDSFHLNVDGMEFISYKYEGFLRQI